MAACDTGFIPSAPEPDLCPMCKGEGKHTLKPPHGIYIHISVNDIEIDKEYGVDIGMMPYSEQTRRVMALVNKYADAGYELIQVIDERVGTYTYGGQKVFIMQWRWR